MDQELLRKSVGENFELHKLEDRDNIWAVYHPFYYQDGDGYEILLEQRDGKYYLTDRGSTSMRFGKVLTPNIATFTGIHYVDGVLEIEVDENKIGDKLFDFIQCIITAEIMLQKSDHPDYFVN